MRTLRLARPAENARRILRVRRPGVQRDHGGRRQGDSAENEEQNSGPSQGEHRVLLKNYGLLPLASGAGLWRSYLRAVTPRGPAGALETPGRPGEAPIGR